MNLFEEIQAKCPELIASKDYAGIVAAVNVNRTRSSGKEIGKGTILETIGLTAGNAFLDVIDTVNDFRHVKGLIAEGRLIVSSPLVMGTIQSFVPAILTQEEADALLTLAKVDDHVNVAQVAQAIENGA